MAAFKTIEHNVDFCVVGGGLAGMCAAVAAARRGVKVALMQDRPVLGGNASSEVRMWVCGAHGDDNRETGILEELMMESYYRNPYKNYSIWDSILFDKVRCESNIELIMNCSCLNADVGGVSPDAGVSGERIIKSVTGWQTTTQQYHRVKAKIFADCSGDSVLAPLTGAKYRVGREAHGEFGESIAPPEADKKTMGMSCLIQARQTDSPKTYIPPVWAEKYTNDNLPPNRRPDMRSKNENFWYLEIGGESDSIADTERLRDELLAMAFGMWDYVKNSGECGDTANWELDWVGFLPGKRESRRYVGDVVVNQNDVSDGGRFGDIVAYGGWTMDDHHPAGFRTAEPPTIFHPAPSPFGMPFRALYSVNIGNLMFAGRNVSLTHMALSAARVMATCAALGQAAGTGAYLALKYNVQPRGVSLLHIDELQQLLMRDDCYLPYNRLRMSDLTARARLESDQPYAENVRNGLDRPIGGDDNGWYGINGTYLTYSFDKPEHICGIRIVFDSDLNRTRILGADEEVNRPMISNRFLDSVEARVPPTMTRAFEVAAILENGDEHVIACETNNYNRLYTKKCDVTATSVSLRPKATWGAPRFHIFAFDIN